MCIVFTKLDEIGAKQQQAPPSSFIEDDGCGCGCCCCRTKAHANCHDMFNIEFQLKFGT